MAEEGDRLRMYGRYLPSELRSDSSFAVAARLSECCIRLGHRDDVAPVLLSAHSHCGINASTTIFSRVGIVQAALRHHDHSFVVPCGEIWLSQVLVEP